MLSSSLITPSLNGDGVMSKLVQSPEILGTTSPSFGSTGVGMESTVFTCIVSVGGACHNAVVPYRCRLQFNFRHFKLEDAIGARNFAGKPLRRIRMPVLHLTAMDSNNNNKDNSSSQNAVSDPDTDNIVLLPCDLAAASFDASTSTLTLTPSSSQSDSSEVSSSVNGGRRNGPASSTKDDLDQGSGSGNDSPSDSTLPAKQQRRESAQEEDADVVVLRHMEGQPHNLSLAQWSSNAEQVASAFQRWFTFARTHQAAGVGGDWHAIKHIVESGVPAVAATGAAASIPSKSVVVEGDGRHQQAEQEDIPTKRTSSTGRSAAATTATSPSATHEPASSLHSVGGVESSGNGGRLPRQTVQPILAHGSGFPAEAAGGPIPRGRSNLSGPGRRTYVGDAGNVASGRVNGGGSVRLGRGLSGSGNSRSISSPSLASAYVPGRGLSEEASSHSHHSGYYGGATHQPRGMSNHHEAANNNNGSGEAGVQFVGGSYPHPAAPPPLPQSQPSAFSPPHLQHQQPQHQQPQHQQQHYQQHVAAHPHSHHHYYQQQLEYQHFYAQQQQQQVQVVHQESGYQQPHAPEVQQHQQQQAQQQVMPQYQYVQQQDQQQPLALHQQPHVASQPPVLMPSNPQARQAVYVATPLYYPGSDGSGMAAMAASGAGAVAAAGERSPGGGGTTANPTPLSVSTQQLQQMQMQQQQHMQQMQMQQHQIQQALYAGYVNVGGAAAVGVGGTPSTVTAIPYHMPLHHMVQMQQVAQMHQQMAHMTAGDGSGMGMGMLQAVPYHPHQQSGGMWVQQQHQQRPVVASSSSSSSLASPYSGVVMSPPHHPSSSISYSPDATASGFAPTPYYFVASPGPVSPTHNSGY